MNAPLLQPPLPAAPDPAGATPVMAQYFEAKARAPGALVFFRMGDFYELFFEDAVAAAGAIGLAVSHRGTHAGAPIPMAGVPVHTAEAYLARLIRAGFQVAVCEQMEDPAAARRRGAKAIVRREVVRIVTPGTLTEEGLLEGRDANRLAAVAMRAGQTAIATVELSTGEVECQLVERAALASVLASLRPSEILVPDTLLAEPGMGAALGGVGGALAPMAAALIEPAASQARVRRLYGVATLDGFGAFSGAEVAALGLLAAHLELTQGGRAPLLRPPRRLSPGDVLAIDPATRASLEIERSLSGAREGSLLAAVDRTVSSAGARLLAARLGRPLTDPAAIAERQDSLAWLLERRPLRGELRRRLKRAGDMARALSRLALGRGGPRDLACLTEALLAAGEIASLIAEAADALSPPPAELAAACRTIDPAAAPGLGALARTLQAGLGAELPVHARDGGFVAAGASGALDEARELRDGARRIVAALETRVAAETGLPLKVRHNAVLGFFLETTARHAEPLMTAPLNAAFIHRQTLANQVRFTTVELNELDARIARAGEQALALELSLFETWRGEAQAAGPDILAAAEALAVIDVAAALAEWAEEAGAVRPRLDRSLIFEARGARHPVVESAVRREGGAFTPNDCALDGAGEGRPRLSIVTGPNMAGKSTFLRQNALLVVLAQAGAFVPAQSLNLGVVDRLFSRVGAGDDLARGRSTFMAEMVETAAILNEATPRSFVILDEIGRGTATWDGLAIAWACAEALHDANRCRALFATHYHELAALEQRLAHVSNLCLKAKEWNGELIFLHEAGTGCADRSYGVQVARLAGVPAPVVARAREVLSRLENEAVSHASLQELPLFAAAAPGADWTPAAEPSLLDAALAALDPDQMSPREALDALYRLKALG